VNAAVVGPTIVEAVDRGDWATFLPRLESYLLGRGVVPLSQHPAWLAVLEDGLGHRCHLAVASQGGVTRGFLGLAYLNTPWFGRFLVSLPYLNYGGAIADDDDAARQLVDHALSLAAERNVRFLELRSQRGIDHPALSPRAGAKVNMRLALPDSPARLWSTLSSKVRNQIRKGDGAGLEVSWGGRESLDGFYEVFSRNMRDLGTPVYGKSFFASIVRHFPDRAEFCVVRLGDRPIAAALLLHGWGITEVPSASSLRDYNSTCANMLMYHRLLERAVGRGQGLFDFGRSSPDSGTYRFKSQWGAEPEAAEWQYFVRAGSGGDMRPDNPRYRRLIAVWRRLPVGLTRLLGPPIVRGIP
jgi:FemAB-related protein (PEP-CTERM system-associated)